MRSAEYYRRYGARPRLWEGIVGAWLPSQRNTGNTVPNQVGNGAGPAYGVGGTQNDHYWATNSSPRGGRQIVAQGNGSNSYWYAPFRLGNLRQATISLWVGARGVRFGTNYTSNSNRSLFAWNDPNTLNAVWVMLYDNPYYTMWLDGTWRGGGGAETLWPQTLTHFALTWGPGRLLNVYANGNVILSHTIASNVITYANEPTHIMLGAGYTGLSLSGAAWDDLRTYNRALSRSEILTLAQRPGIAYEVSTLRHRYSSASPSPSVGFVGRKTFSRILP